VFHPNARLASVDRGTTFVKEKRFVEPTVYSFLDKEREGIVTPSKNSSVPLKKWIGSPQKVIGCSQLLCPANSIRGHYLQM
jgi:hypothetical protein